MKIRLLLILLCATLANAMFSQQTVVPISPNAASIGKYGDVPVSLYTGIPNISIPLYDIVVKDFKLPISLSYHAGGIKVEDISSWVGTGWTLNAGGVLNRCQRGIYDERVIDHWPSSDIDSIIRCSELWPNGFNPYLGIPSPDCCGPTIAESLRNNQLDSECDLFYFSCGQESGKFFLDHEGHSHSMPANKYYIEPTNERVRFPYDGEFTKECFKQWIIKNTNGIQFIFGSTRDNSRFDADIVASHTDCSADSIYLKDQTVTSWYLNEILLPSGESIKFKYDYFRYCISQLPSSEWGVGMSGLQNNRTYKQTIFARSVELREITFPHGKITFIPRIDRFDTNIRMLDSIKIYRGDIGSYALFKSYKFNIEYGNRLWLNSVEEVSPMNTQNRVYSFEYSSKILPSIYSGSQDFWGYYNNRTEVGPFSPIQFVLSPEGAVLFYRGEMQGSYRAVDETLSKYGMLTKITYPTGGYTTFEYENNTGHLMYYRAGFLQLAGEIWAGLSRYNKSPQSAGIGFESTTGFDVGYSNPFYSSGESASVESSFMDYDNNCGYTDAGGAGYLWHCADIGLEQKNGDTWVNYRSSLHFGDGSPKCGFDKGTYRIKVTFKGARKGDYLRVSLSWMGFTEAQDADNNPKLGGDHILGGLRIRRIKDYDPVTKKTSVRKYTYGSLAGERDESGMMHSESESSGVIQTLPVHVITDPHKASVGLIFLGSFNNSSMYQTQGSYVGYGKVRVDYGENAENGREVYYYTTYDNYPDVDIEKCFKRPFMPSAGCDWRRGLLKKVEYYNNSEYSNPIKTIDYTYLFNTSAENFKEIKCVKVPGDMTSCTDVYKTFTESFSLSQTVTTENTKVGDIITTTTYVQSPKSLADSSSTFINSRGEQITNYTRCVADIFHSTTTGNDPAGIAIGIMKKTYNMVNTPIEKYTVKTMVDGTKYVIGGSLTIYCQDKPLPKAVYSLEISSPLLLSNFTPCAIDASGNFVKDSRYKPQVTFDLYDGDDNILEQHKEGDMHTSYLWSYFYPFPIVKIEGKAYSDIDQRFKSNISNHHFSNAITYGGTNGTNGIHSDVVWLKDLLYTLLTDHNFVVTYYTYAPLIGMTSQTDPNGVTTYYEYDSFGRLKCTRDDDGNILKTYEYKYKQ